MLCALLTTGVHFYAHLTVWWSNYLYTTLFCWKFSTSCKMGHYWNYEECCSKYKCLQALKIFFACRFALTVLYWKLLYDFTSFALALKLQFVWCGTCVMRVPEKKQRKQKKQTNKLRAFLTYVVSTSVLQNFDRFFIKYFIFPQHENGNLLTCQLISSMAGLDSFWRTSSTSFQRAWFYLLFQCEQAIKGYELCFLWGTFSLFSAGMTFSLTELPSIQWLAHSLAPTIVRMLSACGFYSYPLLSWMYTRG